MAQSPTARKVTNFISISLFIIIFSLMAYNRHVWPGLLLALWAALICRQSLSGRHMDVLLTTFVFGGLFLTFVLIVNWNTLLPFLFTLTGIGLVYREYFLSARWKKKERQQELNQHELIEQKQDPKRKDISINDTKP